MMLLKSPRSSNFQGCFPRRPTCLQGPVWGSPCVDEYKPSRAKAYDLIDSDAKTGSILYIAPIDYLGLVSLNSIF